MKYVQTETLDDLRSGAKNLIISTSICREGIDIGACNIVICFEKPPNLKSFIQRRGRLGRPSLSMSSCLRRKATVVCMNGNLWKRP